MNSLNQITNGGNLVDSKPVYLTNLHDGGEKGTLRRLLEDTDPPFHLKANVKGTILLAPPRNDSQNPDWICVCRKSNVTLDLQGITISRGQLLIGGGAHDVIVNGLTADVGDNPEGYWDLDGITVFGEHSPVERILIRHCTFKHALDECGNVWGQWDQVGFENCRFSEGMHTSHPDRPGSDHSMGFISGGEAPVGMQRRLYLRRCVFENNGSRNPQMQGPCEVEMANCVVKNPGSYGTVIAMENGGSPKINLIGNMFIPGPATQIPNRLPIHLGTAVDKTSVYVRGNLWFGHNDAGWNLVGDYRDSQRVASVLYKRPFAWPLSTIPTQPASVKLAEEILATAGSLN